MTIDFDPVTPANCWDDPYPTYQRLREEAPVHFSPSSNIYCVSRYDDVVSVLRQTELFSSASAFDVLFARLLEDIGWRDVVGILGFLVRARVSPAMMRRGPTDSLIMLDPPEHGARRSIVNRGFTPRQIADWRPRIQEIVTRCMAKYEAGEPFDVVHDLAIPVPMEVIADILGVESEQRLDFKHWSDCIVAGVSSMDRKNARRGYFRAMSEIFRYVSRVVEERTAEPRDDLISVLVDPARGTTLDRQAIIQFVLLLLVAGNETTTNLIGNATLALLRNPEQLERVIAEPGLVPGMVEETLRYDGPVHFIMRRATRETQIAGVTIPRNARVAALLASANRDEQRFDRADRFDVQRDAKGHVAFGFGTHFCLGASLARMEATEALAALVPALAGHAAPTTRIPMIDSVLVRGPSRLPLARVA